MTLTPAALTTPARVRAAQGWSESAYPDARLIPKINAISERVEMVTGRKWGFRRIPTESPLWVASSGGDLLWLPLVNVRSLTQVTLAGEELDLQAYSYPSSVNNPGGVFRLPETDRLGHLFRPAGWPRAAQSWSDLTGHPNLSSAIFRPNVAVAGDFGFILPQFHSTVDATHNPDGLPADLPAAVEGVLAGLVLQALMGDLASNAIRRETTAGGREVEYADVTSQRQLTVDQVLMDNLGDWVSPDSRWAG